jgi:hypothetical protein
MLKRTFALMMVLSIILVACQNNDSNAKDPKEAAEIESVPYTLLHSGVQSGIKDPAEFIIDNKAMLDSIWRAHYSYLSLSIQPESPNIDFEEDVVVAFFLGDQPSSGYWIRLDSVYIAKEAKELVLAITTNQKPDPDKDILKIATQPNFFVAIPKTEYDIKFDLALQSY